MATEISYIRSVIGNVERKPFPCQVVFIYIFDLYTFRYRCMCHDFFLYRIKSMRVAPAIDRSGCGVDGGGACGATMGSAAVWAVAPALR